MCNNKNAVDNLLQLIKEKATVHADAEANRNEYSFNRGLGWYTAIENSFISGANLMQSKKDDEIERLEQILLKADNALRMCFNSLNGLHALSEYKEFENAHRGGGKTALDREILAVRKMIECGLKKQ